MCLKVGTSEGNIRREYCHWRFTQRKQTFFSGESCFRVPLLQTSFTSWDHWQGSDFGSRKSICISSHEGNWSPRPFPATAFPGNIPAFVCTVMLILWWVGKWGFFLREFFYNSSEKKAILELVTSIQREWRSYNTLIKLYSNTVYRIWKGGPWGHPYKKVSWHSSFELEWQKRMTQLSRTFCFLYCTYREKRS